MLNPDLALHLHMTPMVEPTITELLIPPLESIDILYVYGVGRGGFEEWLAGRDKRQLIFLEDDLKQVRGLTPCLMNHPRVHLKWISRPSQWDLVLEECASEFPQEKIEVIATTPYKKRSLFRKIRQTLFRKSLLWHSAISETINSHLLHQNIIPNLLKIPRCSYVNHWRDRFKNVPLIICGAGPSLKIAAPALQKVGNRAIILGCGSALSALSHLRIRPHLGIAIDPNEREFDCLKGCADPDLPLLFGGRLYSKVFDLFDGPFCYIRSGSSSRFENHVEENLGLAAPLLGYDLGREALSVTTLALSLGCYFGCNPIILAGVDLAYDQTVHYAEGVPTQKRFEQSALRRKNKQGKWVFTLTKWIMEQETIDRYAKNHPETVFVNSSKGLGFPSICDTPLEQIKLPSLDCTGLVHDVIAETKIQITSSQIKAVFKPLKTSLERCLELISLLKHEEGGRAVLYEYELQDELAYEVFLGEARRDFDRFQSGERWNYLQEITNSYLLTLRTQGA